MELISLRKSSHKNSRTKPLDFKKGDFNQLQEIVGKVPRADKLKENEIQ